MLNVVSIEHLILRHSPDAKQVCKRLAERRMHHRFPFFIKVFKLNKGMYVDDDKGIIMGDDGQTDLLHSYGLGYPEPNVVFALCRGSRSSPAVRVSSSRPSPLLPRVPD